MEELYVLKKQRKYTAGFAGKVESITFCAINTGNGREDSHARIDRLLEKLGDAYGERLAELAERVIYEKPQEICGGEIDRWMERRFRNRFIFEPLTPGEMEEFEANLNAYKGRSS